MQAEFLFLQGFVKARLAMFDKPTPKPSRKLVSGSRHFQEIINNNNLISIRNNEFPFFPDFLIRQRELRTFKPPKATKEEKKKRGATTNPESAKMLLQTPELKLHKAQP